MNVHKTQLAATDFLQKQGFAVKKSKFNNDFRAGLIAANDDGHFEEGALLAYAAVHLAARAKAEDGRAQQAALGQMTADQELKRVQAERQRVKLARERGEVMARADFEREVAARAQFFRGELEQIPATVVPDLVALVGGDESKIPQASRLLSEALTTAMDAWSREREFVVTLEDAANG